MNRADNPFNPGPGTPPPVLLGRNAVLEDIDVALKRLKKGRSVTPVLLVGLRGVGKTVLLVEAQKRAEKEGIINFRFEVDEVSEYNFKQTIFNKLQSAVFKLDTIENLKAKFKKQLAIFKNIAVNIGGVEFKADFDLEPVHGEGDSKIFADNLMTMMREVGLMAREREKVICFFIDELQNLSKEDLAALLGSIHRLVQESLPIVVIGAGLPSLPAKIAEAKTYAERFGVMPIGALSKEETYAAFRTPLEQEHVTIESDALAYLVEASGGYPYFIQQFGKSAWDFAPSSPISLDSVKQSMYASLQELDNGFFKTRYDRSTESERQFMHCMATAKNSPYDMADIGKCLNKKPNQTAPVRSNLIDKGFIYSVGHGKIDFTVPLFADFLRRNIS
jgi:AAA ATPase domain